MYFSDFVFGAYMWILVIFSWWIFLLMKMYYPFLYFMISYGLKSIMSYIIMAIPACFWGPFVWNIFFYIFYPELISVLGVKVCFLEIAKSKLLVWFFSLQKFDHLEFDIECHLSILFFYLRGPIELGVCDYNNLVVRQMWV